MDVKASIECLSKMILEYEEMSKKYIYNGATEVLGYKILKEKIDSLYTARSNLKHNAWILTKETTPYVFISDDGNVGTSHRVICCDENGDCLIGRYYYINGHTCWISMLTNAQFDCIAWMELPDTNEIIRENKFIKYRNKLKEY